MNASEPFKREERYIVIKRKNLDSFQEDAIRLCLKTWGRGTVECVVIESDWPEYETVWRMIEERVTGNVPSGETVSFVQEWMMSGDHEPDKWHKEFATAIDARCRNARHEERKRMIAQGCVHTRAAYAARGETMREDLRAWQTEQHEWFDPTILEIIGEYAKWRDGQAVDAPVPETKPEAKWGDAIQLEGQRPDWLKDDDGFQWSDEPDFKKPDWSIGRDRASPPLMGSWSMKFIRLPANHPYYLATERGFIYWPGGEVPPLDWDEKKVLLKSGELGLGLTWSRNSPSEFGYQGDNDVIGYHRKAFEWDRPRVGALVHKDKGAGYFTADINLGDHHGKVQCYGATEEEAKAIAEKIVGYMLAANPPEEKAK